MHSLIDPAGSEITERLNIKHENSRTDQGKGYQARVLIRTLTFEKYYKVQKLPTPEHP